MLKDDSLSESTDDYCDREILANQENTPIFNNKANAAPSLQSAMNLDAIPSSQPLTIQKTSLSAPIIYEDIWGDDVEEYCGTETSFSPGQILNADTEPIKEWIEYEEQSVEEDDHTLFLSENSNEISASPVASSFAADEHAADLLTKFEDFDALSSFDDMLEQDLLLDDLELLDIDAALAELNEEELPFSQTEKQARGVIIGQGNVSGWMGSYGLFYINWEYGAAAEQEALKRLGYAELEISKATRAFVIQAARATGLPRRQERELTTKLGHTRLLLARLPMCHDSGNDSYAEERTALIAEIADLERMLVYKMQWVAVKKAAQYVGRGIDLDDLIQYGMLGVIAGVRHYDVNKNARLLVITNWWVFQSLNRAVAENVRLIRVPVYLAETLANIKRQHTALQITLGRLPNLNEFADVLQIPMERLKELLHLNEKLLSWEWCRLTEDFQEGYSFQQIENTGVSNDIFDDEMDKIDGEQDIEAMLELLSIREKQVITLRFGLHNDESRTLEEVGRVIHTTRERARQIEERAIKKIKSAYFPKKNDTAQSISQKTEEITLKTKSEHEPKLMKTSRGKKAPLGNRLSKASSR
jgi:RNA polymerase sigma factor (sigma-70 family)